MCTTLTLPSSTVVVFPTLLGLAFGGGSFSKYLYATYTRQPVSICILHHLYKCEYVMELVL